MYWIETINGHCDCMEAQRFSRGESVDLKKFRKDKIRRSILGNKEVWDESKILDQIKTIFERKRSKYEMVDIQILQTRYNDGTLASTTTLTEPLFDSEWEVYYTSQGNFLKDLTQEHIEEQIRGAHDIDCMVNLLVKHEEIHDKFRYNKKTDVEMSDIMQEYEIHENNITQISEDEWAKLDLGGLVEYKISDDVWFNYADGNHYIYNQPENKYDRIDY